VRQSTAAGSGVRHLGLTPGGVEGRVMDKLAQTIDAVICEVAAMLWLVKAASR
jgi:hypothetical protein